jgi:hypothetical protein
MAIVETGSRRRLLIASASDGHEQDDTLDDAPVNLKVALAFESLLNVWLPP